MVNAYRLSAPLVVSVGLLFGQQALPERDWALGHPMGLGGRTTGYAAVPEQGGMGSSSCFRAALAMQTV